jgi:hypothetical protein
MPRCRRKTAALDPTMPVIGLLVIMVMAARGLPAAAAGEPSPGEVRTGLFGLEADGSRFVYLIDRSASMAAAEGGPLAAAKRELIRSLDDLGRVQQFQVIAYNQRLSHFRPTGGRRGLAFGDESNLRRAVRFIESIRADGATRHAPAIDAALALAPDTIFLLTDADAPDDLEREEFERLAERLGGTRMLVVQFGPPGGVCSPRLAALAERSGGRYRSVSVDP